MTPANANEKLIIDLKHVLEDIDALMEMDSTEPWYRNGLRRVRNDITFSLCGEIAQKELEDDRERAKQGAHAQKGAHA